MAKTVPSMQVIAEKALFQNFNIFIISLYTVEVEHDSGTVFCSVLQEPTCKYTKEGLMTHGQKNQLEYISPSIFIMLLALLKITKDLMPD